MLKKTSKENRQLDKSEMQKIVLLHALKKQMRTDALDSQRKRMKKLFISKKDKIGWWPCRIIVMRQALGYDKKLEIKIDRLKKLIEACGNLVDLISKDTELTEKDFLDKLGNILNEIQFTKKRLSLEYYHDADYFERKMASW